jgi:DNA/RNA endonuclease G (NUC1)
MACMVRRRFVLAVFLLCPALSTAQSPLENCAAQFIDDDVANAPTIGGTPPDEPFLSNVHQCYRDDGVSFFAMEYWPEQFAPRWLAYMLAPENYGADGCATFTRDGANCYIREQTWQGFLECENASDPFHADHMLGGTILAAGDFGSTGHDRGHLAPRQAFSWHVCATYQTFTMANMSPQRAFLNQDIWRLLEEQVLTWAFDAGPLYIVTGTTFRTFPHASFAVYEQDEVLDPDQIYTTSSRMQQVVAQHRENFQSTSVGDILRPKRDANPENVRAKVADMRMPTGYFKVVSRPAIDGEPAHAIGFLLPHSFENLNMLVDSYESFPREEAFWAFAARIDLIEQTAGMSFPGIPQSLKTVWRDGWFFERKGSRSIRIPGCGMGTPQGVIENSTADERLAACIDHLE